MKQRNISLLLTFCFSLLCTSVYGYDIAVANDDGVVIYYSYVSNGTELAVTSSGTSNNYSGVVNVPESVIYDGVSREVTSIGRSAFRNCAELITLNLPNTIKKIYSEAFYGCSGLTELKLPQGVESISLYQTFANCTSLTELILPENASEDFKGDNGNISREFQTDAFLGCKNLKEITISRGVDYIHGSCFIGCTNLEKITFLNDSILIDDHSLEETAWYKNQPDGVVYLGRVLYRYKGDVSENAIIKVKEGTLSIAPVAFAPKKSDDERFSKISKIELPDGLYHIGRNAFYRCSGLTSLSIPNSVTTISEAAFRDCSGLTSVSLGSELKTIGGYAFYNCGGITSIVIPDSVVSIGSSAFYDCSLTSINIPGSVTSIGNGAFQGSIMEVKSKILEPFNLNADVFSQNTYRNGTLYIPQGTMSLYTRFDGWRNFLNIQEEEADGEPKYLTLNIAGNGVLQQQIELGRSYSFRIVPDEGWRINAVVFNGEDVTAQLSADNMYETPAISDNATLVVSFESEVPDAVRAERRNAVRVYASEGSIVVRDGSIGSLLTVYDMQGRCMANERITEPVQKISLPPSSVYIVKTEGKTIKVGL